MNKPKWTQDEAIAYESARECITHMIAICIAKIAHEEGQAVPDAVLLAGLEKNLADLARERTALTVTDHEKIATIRREYGAQVRERLAQNRQQAT